MTDVATGAAAVATGGTFEGVLAGIQLVWEIVKEAKELAAFIEHNKDEKWFQDCSAVFSGWKNANTPEDKKRAAENVRDLLRRLG